MLIAIITFSDAGLCPLSEPYPGASELHCILASADGMLETVTRTMLRVRESLRA